MKPHNVRKHLKQAANDVKQVRDHDAVSGDRDLLVGIAKQLDYFVEGDTKDPEATVYPERGALDSIQARLGTVIDRTDDDTCADHLGRARRQLMMVIMTLEDRWQNQHRVTLEDEGTNR
jgi:hypothetical protein